MGGFIIKGNLSPTNRYVQSSMRYKEVFFTCIGQHLTTGKGGFFDVTKDSIQFSFPGGLTNFLSTKEDTGMFYTEDYHFEVKDGEYFVHIVKTGDDVKVTKDIFDTLRKSYQNESKREERHPTFPLDTDNGGSAQKIFSYHSNPEKIYINKETSEYFYRLLRKNCTDFELRLLEAIVLEKRTVTEFAQEMDMPRTTLQSKKISLFKRLRKILHS